jgi:diguanylate cyclase (GGDEF)-like protein/PAS domain S-box-containing protein
MQKRLESVFYNSLDGIAFLDSELGLVDCNSTFWKMIGFDSKEEMIRVREDKASAYGRYIRDFANRILDQLKTKTHIRIQRDLDRYDGKSFVADVVFSTIGNLKGEFVGYAVNLRDNTDMYRKATTDRLTRINNKMHFEELADYEIKRSRRTGTCLSLIVCDIDHFKKINDTYGHLCGDLVLKEITSDIKLMLRATDIFARVGGEEFAILLPSTMEDAAYSVAEKIRGAIEKRPFIYSGNEFKLTMSFGISEFKPGISKEKSLEDLFKSTDKRLYYSKNHGRNRITSKDY